MAITATQTSFVIGDLDGDGIVDPADIINPVPTTGDTVRTTVVITNTGGGNATVVSFVENGDGHLNGMTQIGNINVSPIAFNDSYTAIGNTLLEVGNATNQTGPQKSVAGHVTDNDVEYFGDTFTISAFQATSANGGTVTMVQSGADMGSFTYVSAANFTGTDTFTYTITDKGLDGIAGNADDLSTTATVTITVANQVWYVDANAATNGDGTSTNPFNTLASVSGVGDADDAGDIIFMRAGNYTTGVTLEASQTLWGEGSALIVDGFTLLNAGGDAVIDPGAGVGVTLNIHNTLKGFTVEDTGTDISGTDVGNLTISNVDLTGTGRLVNLTTSSAGSVNATFDTAISTGTVGNADGVTLSNLAGSITFNNAAISGTNGTGVGFRVSGGAANIDYNGTITEINDAQTISVTGKSGGTVSFDGAVSSTSASDGIFLNNNGGATIGFTGALTLNTSASGTAAFTATGGGTVTATASGSTINSGAGTAINVNATNIGAADLTFQSVSAGTGAGTAGVGISLVNTGTAGGLHITGTGTANSGGTIQHKTGADGSTTSGIGIYLNNTSEVTLNNMNLHDFDNLGIFGQSVNGIKLTNSTIGGTIGTSTGSNDAPIAFGTTDPGGTNGFATGSSSLIDNVDISGSIEHNFEIYQQSGTFNLTIQNSTIHDNSATTGSDGLQIETSGTAHAIVKVDNVTFDDNKSQAVQVDALGNSHLELTLNNNDVLTSTQGNEGFVLQNGASGDLTVAVTNNTFTGVNGTNILVGNVVNNATTSAELNATISGNVMTLDGPAVNRTLVAFFSSTAGQNPVSKVVIDGNTINTIADPVNGLAESLFVSTPDAGTDPIVYVQVSNNVVNIDDNNHLALRGIAVQSTQDTSTMHADVRGNDVNYLDGAPAGVNGIRVRQVSPATLDLEPGVGGANAAAVLANNNPLSTTEIVGTVTVSANNNTVLQPSTPATPTLPSFLQAAPADDSTTVTTPPVDNTPPAGSDDTSTTEAASGTVASDLTQVQLDTILSAAIARWEAAGLTAEQDAYLHNVTFTVADMSGMFLGQAIAGHISIDSNAAGYGWYVDANPADDVEFASGGGTRLVTDATGTPAGHIDLLTTVMHELGHQLGLSDSYALADRDSLMYGYLVTGERRLPGEHQADNAIAGSIAHEEFLVGPITIGTLEGGQSATIQWDATVNAQSNQLIQNLSNQGTVTGNQAGAFSVDTDGDGNSGNGTQATITVLDSLALGNLVFWDKNADGLFNGSDVGVNGVTLSLFVDANNDNTPDSPASPIATTTTAGGGLYSFTGIAPGHYIVRVDAGNFSGPAGALKFLQSSPVTSPEPIDPDTANTDNDDNGARTLGSAAFTNAITLTYNNEPTAGAGNDTNNTLDLGFTNIAPVLDAGATPTLTAINEDAGAPGVGSGTLVSQLVDLTPPTGGLDNVTDADSTQTGLALTGVNNTNGTWKYSLDGGANWTAVPAVDDNSALLLMADANTRLYFQPNANFFGTSSITFRAWDQTDGSANGTSGVDPSPGGDSTAFSAVFDTASITVNAVNDVPQFAALGGPAGFTEEGPAVQLDTNATISDIELDAANDYGGATLTLVRSTGGNDDDIFIDDNGTLTFGATEVSLNNIQVGTYTHLNGTLIITFDAGATSADADSVLQQLTYRNTSDNPPASVTINYTFSDGNSGLQGSGATPGTATGSVFVNITPQNDAPALTITPTEYNGSPNTAIDLKNNGLSVSDVDGNAGSETVTLSVTSGTLTVTTGGSGAGVAGSGTSSVTITGTIAQINALLNTDGTSTVSYLDSVGGTKTLTLLIHDNGNTGGGDLSASDTANIILDNPPTTDNVGPFSGAEDSTSPARIVVTLSGNDVDAGDAVLNFKIETVSANGQLFDAASGGTLLTAGSTVPATGSGPWTATVYFQPNADFNGPTSFTYSAFDGDVNDPTPATASITVSAVNDPVTGTAPATFLTDEDTPVAVAGMSITDVDATLAPGGIYEVTLTSTNGVLTLGTTAGLSFASGANGTATMTFRGTLSDINTALGTASYGPGANYNGPATITLQVTDDAGGIIATGSGAATSDSDVINVTVNAVNDPVTGTAPATASVNEDASVAIVGMSIADVDVTLAPGGIYQVTLSSANGTLTLTTVTGLTFGTGDGSDDPTMVFSGTLSDINTALGTASYTPNADYNGAATVTLQVTDDVGGTVATGSGVGTSDSDAINVTVNAVNDPVTGTAPATLLTDEDTPVAVAGMSITDVDATLAPGGIYEVTLTSTNGVLTLGTTAGLSFASGANGTATMTFRGTLSDINTALGTASYGPGANYNGPATITLQVTDDAGGIIATGSGAATSDSDVINVTVNSVNDAPVLTGFGDASAFTENGSSVVLDTVQDASVSDVELDGSASNYAGATLTIARNGGANADDAFVATGSLDLIDFNSNGENVSLDLGGGTFKFIGTSNNPGDGSLSFTFNSDATAADIASVMRQIAYANISDNPPTSAQIDFTFTDGNGDPLGQPQGAGATPGTTTRSFTVNITQVDDAPVLLNVAPGAAYSPGSSGVVLSPALNVFDVDATPPSTLVGIASATIKIASGFFAGDELFVNLPTSGGFFIVDDGTGPIVTNISVTSNAGGTLTLGGTDTTLHYQLVLDVVNYRSTAADPSNGGLNSHRDISWQVNDGALNSQTPNPDPNNLVSVTVLHFDVAPTLDLDASGASTGFATTFTENGAPIAIVDTDVSVADPDNANVDSAAIVLTNAKAGDALSVAGTLPIGMSSSIDTSIAGQITLHLSGSASLADYQTALGQLRFVNTSDNPDTTDRDITVKVTNNVDSNIAHATVHVTALNDAPVNAAPGAQSVNEDTNLAIAGLAVSDPDANAGSLTTTLSVLHGTLTVASAGGAGVSGSGTGSVTLTGTLAQINTTLSASSNVVYKGALNFNGADTLTIVTNDGGNSGTGGALSDTDTVAITVNPVNDAPINTVPGAQSVNEEANLAIAGLSISDLDAGAGTLTTTLSAAHGTVTVSSAGGAAVSGSGTGSVTLTGTLAQINTTLSASGNVVYKGVLDFNGSDALTVVTNDGGNSGGGGAQSDTDTVAITVNPVNDAPTNTLPSLFDVEANTTAALGGISVSDPDAGAGTMTTTLSVAHGTLAAGSMGGVAVSGSGTGVLTLSGTLAGINATLGNLTYHGNHDFFGVDALNMVTNDGGNSGSGGALTDNDAATLRVNTLLAGTPRNDSFTALPGNERIDGNGGIDTVTFGFRLVDAAVTFSGNQIIIDGPTGSHTVLSGSFKVFNFTDGTVNNNDGNALIDDLYYNSRYHDVWNAHIDADVHYNAFGWHEMRDPDAFFNTAFYEAVYADVRSSGVNPLTHYDSIGWQEHRIPSFNFDGDAYRNAYPDVKVANIDPLEHFLAFGAGEGRVPFTPAALIAADGFDYIYYLQHNPDVLAAHVDPLIHYQTFGWLEGRNPNALFDNNGYLATYTDVAAAHVNPLDHYHNFGWMEGRDPSVNFDTTDYLNAYPDIAAAHIDPLKHYLQFGQFEGRSPFPDGHFG
jgi:hypothetical protein